MYKSKFKRTLIIFISLKFSIFYAQKKIIINVVRLLDEKYILFVHVHVQKRLMLMEFKRHTHTQTLWSMAYSVVKYKYNTI